MNILNIPSDLLKDYSSGLLLTCPDCNKVHRYWLRDLRYININDNSNYYQEFQCCQNLSVHGVSFQSEGLYGEQKYDQA